MITTANEINDFSCGRDLEQLTAETLDNRGIELLLGAVAADAAKSWRRCVKQITEGCPSRTVYEEKKRIEQWMTSGETCWMLLGVEGEAIIHCLEHECGIDKLPPEQKRKYDADYMLKRMKSPVTAYQMYLKKEKVRRIPIKKDGDFDGKTD